MKILSLFDWISCWQQALNNLWIKDYTYFASEIDKSAIEITMKNFPNTVQLWDVTKLNLAWNFDLLIWGSPCQWFSFAWKQLNFNDPRSALFFEYVKILKEIKPKYFLLENVRMKKEYQDIISDNLFWIEPVRINSNLLTANNRDRLYWVWELQSDGSYKKVDIKQPEDKNILLKDIITLDYKDDKYYLRDDQYKYLKDFWCKNSFWWKINNLNWKASPILKSYWKCSWNWWKIKDNKWIRIYTPNECEILHWLPINYTEWISDNKRYSTIWNGWTIPVIEYIFSHLKLTN